MDLPRRQQLINQGLSHLAPKTPLDRNLVQQTRAMDPLALAEQMFVEAIAATILQSPDIKYIFRQIMSDEDNAEREAVMLLMEDGAIDPVSIYRQAISAVRGARGLQPHITAGEPLKP